VSRARASHGRQKRGDRLRLDGKDSPRFGHAFEFVLAAVGKGPAGADDEVANGAADEHLARPREAADACADVNGDPADVTVGEQFALASVQTGTDLQCQATDAVAVADAGYWHQKQMESVINKGIQLLIPPDAGKRRGTRPGWDGGAYAHMRRVLETDNGGGLYRKRKAMIEPVFANTKFNRRIDRFQRRGRSAARSEWRLITATHNLLKLHKHQLAAAAA
jgi:Transposase DDE domain